MVSFCLLQCWCWCIVGTYVEMQHIIVLQICNLVANLKKKSSYNICESQNLEPGAIYYEITLVLKAKNHVYHNTILRFTHFLV